jgi:hypothetical protein
MKVGKMEIVYFLVIILILFFLLSNPILYDSLGRISPLLAKNGKPHQWTVFIIAIIFALLAWLIFYLMKICGTKQGFHFEVTPSKTQCMWANWKHCPPNVRQGIRCCPKGFYGRPIGFEYSPDWSRGNPCLAGCPKCTPNNPHSFSKLDQTYNIANIPSGIGDLPVWPHNGITSEILNAPLDSPIAIGYPQST